MTPKQKEIMRDYIGKMSYYNAAEGGSWGAERSGREQLKAAAALDIIKWLKDGLDLAELKEFVQENRQLSSFSDYISTNMLNAVLSDSLGVAL